MNLEKFIKELDAMSRAEVQMLWLEASTKATDFTISPGLRPMWRDMAELLAAEVRRYSK